MAARSKDKSMRQIGFSSSGPIESRKIIKPRLHVLQAAHHLRI
jgi:hypothetical protein